MKVLNLKISSCKECPYKQYDSDYGRSYDSGFDCMKVGFRLIDDNALTRNCEVWPFDIHPRCPLEDEKVLE